MEFFEDCQHGLLITNLWLRMLRGIDNYWEFLRITRNSPGGRRAGPPPPG
jgi:hypothetical protein